MKKTKKDYSKLTIQEAMDWVDKNCTDVEVRNRLRSRAVPYIIGTYLLMAMDTIDDLEKLVISLGGEIPDYTKIGESE